MTLTYTDGKSTQIYKYSIVKSELKHIEKIVELAERGAYEVEIYTFNKIDVYNLTKEIIRKHVCISLLYGDEVVGYVGGVIFPNPYDVTFKRLLTMSWYVTPKHRNIWSLKLLKNYIKEGVNKKVNSISMHSRMSKDPIRMTVLYERLGFEAIEIAYELDTGV